MVSPEQLRGVLVDVWEAMFAHVPADGPVALAGPVVVSEVDIAAPGGVSRVSLLMGVEGARRATALMLMVPCDDVDDVLMLDGVAELANMLGGTLKSAHVPAGRLGLPVVQALDAAPSGPAGVVVAAECFGDGLLLGVRSVS